MKIRHVASGAQPKRGAQAVAVGGGAWLHERAAALYHRHHQHQGHQARPTRRSHPRIHAGRVGWPSFGHPQGDPRYILDLLKRIVTVSLETIRLLKSLPTLRLSD